MGTVYDLTGIEGFEEFLIPILENIGIPLGTAEDLAGMPASGLSQHMAILSDNRFSEQQTDQAILLEIDNLGKTGLHMLYIGTPRSDLEFMESLERKKVQTLFQEELDSDKMADWLRHVLSQWQQEKKEKSSSKMFIQSSKFTQEDLQVAVGPLCPLCIILSGAPGCGTTFVGINLATLMATVGAVNYIEAGLRPVLTTWLSGGENVEEQASLQIPLKPSLTEDNLVVYTRNPFGDENVQLREIAETAIQYVDPVVMDLGLQEYLSTIEYQFAQKTVRVLITTSDIHRCRYLAGLPADVVVINQTPKRLPLDVEEFQSFWPDAKVVFVPYEAEQSSAITQGVTALEVSESMRAAMERLTEAVQGGKKIEDRIVG